MNKFLLLLKTFLCQRYRIDKGNKKNKILVLVIVLGICMLPMAVIMAIGFYNAGLISQQLGIVREMLTFLITASQVVVLMFGLIELLNTVYLSKDSQLLLALPASSATVYSAKLAYVYVQELIANFALSLLILLPFGIGAKVQWWYYLQLIPTIVISPMLPLLIASILAIPLMWIVGFFKNKGIITTVFYLAIFATVTSVYYAFLFKMQSNPNADGEISDLIAGLVANYSLFARYILPNFLLAGSLVAVTVGGYFGGLFGSLGINIALMAIAVLISSAVYRTSIARRLETPKSHKKAHKEEKYKPKGKVRAILKNDFSHTVRDTQVGVSMGMGLILLPIMIVIMFVGLSSSDVLQLFANDMMRVAFVGIISAFFSFMALSCNIAACSAFSREGSKIYVYKTLPVDAATLTRAKVVYSALYNAIQVILSGIVLGIVLKADIIAILIGSIVMWGVCYGSSNINIYVDMAKPRLVWNTFNEGVKNNPSSLASLAIGFVIVLLYGGLAVGMGIWYSAALFAPYVLVVYYVAIILITAVYCFVTRKILANNCAHLYKQMGE